MLRPLFALLCASVLCTAQDAGPIQEQPAPFSVWLDFAVLSRPGTADPALPIWFEGLQTIRTKASGNNPPKTLYRLRIRRLPGLQSEVLLRVFFDDLPDMQPVIRTWTETGKERFASEPLGSGLGLPTSANVIVPLEGADYIDIDVPGDGSNVRGALAASLKQVSVRQTIDFSAPAPSLWAPFGGVEISSPPTEDTKLFGRVEATLDREGFRLTPETESSVEFEIDLAAQPLAAIVSFEVVNADLSSPPSLALNGVAIPVSIRWPDLADPGYRGEARGEEAHLRFQYTGWIAAQAVLPANVIRAGLNKLSFDLSEGSGPVAIRNVSLQLKQNWKHFDYILTPARR